VQLCGINSAVECQLPKLKVASSNLVSRSIFQVVWEPSPTQPIAFAASPAHATA
jgi:hypothetical protein